MTVIATNHPVVLQDLPDVLYADRNARDGAVCNQIRELHEIGRLIFDWNGQHRGIGNAEPPVAAYGCAAFGAEREE